MSNLLTIHQLVSIPWSNLNRDDTGTPKRLYWGGVLRGQLSSQAIKRAARGQYEGASQDISVRSSNLAAKVAKRVLELAEGTDPKAAEREAKKAIGQLTKGGVGEDDSQNRSAWLSAEELEAAAQAIAEGKSPKVDEFVGAGKTGALAIAAFGRMFANAQQQNTEAAIAVSPAVSTHEAIIETDYFSTVDDAPSASQGAGSSYLGTATFTDGVFYRSTTIDKAQLKRSWTGVSEEAARDQLAAMVEALIYALPKGKKNATAPYTMPEVIFAEEQAHRIAYDFETPVEPGKDGKAGFMAPSVERLSKQIKAARRFDPDNFGPLEAVSGVTEQYEQFETEYLTKKELITKIVDWILE